MRCCGQILATSVWGGLNDTLQGKENFATVSLGSVGEIQYVVYKVRCTFWSVYEFYSFEVCRRCSWWFCVPADVPLRSLVLIFKYFQWVFFKYILIFCWPCISIYLFININQLDALNFMISLFQASTCFEHNVLIVRRPKLYYTTSGIITPIGGRPMHSPLSTCARGRHL